MGLAPIIEMAAVQVGRLTIDIEGMGNRLQISPH